VFFKIRNFEVSDTTADAMKTNAGKKNNSTKQKSSPKINSANFFMFSKNKF